MVAYIPCNGIFKLIKYVDYWTSVIFKKLVGTKALNVADSTTLGRTVRVYAFCSVNITGGVVLAALNVNNYPIQFQLQEGFQMYPRLEYQLTAPDNDMSSSQIELNGHVLTAQPTGDLPDLNGALVQANEPITMAPLSYGLFVFPDAKSSACE